MELIKQVTSLELSKKLKELGVKQDSLFYWKLERSEKYRLVYEKNLTAIGLMGEMFSAFTSSELGEMLPNQTICRKDYIKTTGNIIYQVEVANIKTKEIIFSKTEADARAKLLIYLIENKLLIILNLGWK